MKFKKMISWGVYFTLMFVIPLTSANAINLIVTLDMHEFRLEEKGKDRIYIYEAGALKRTCHLDRSISEGMKISFDKKAIIVNAKRYLLISDLLNCNDSKYVQEQKIPGTVGWLADINVQHKIYVAVDMEDSTPWGCIATVAKLPGSKNIISMPGTNIVKSRKKNTNNISCSYEPFISPDGRYITLNSIQCSSDNIKPSVWDIKNDKGVVFSAEKYSEKEISSKCNELFGIKDAKN